MSLYRCTCNQWYTHTKEFDDLLNTITVENSVVEVVAVCPECGAKTVIGGESDWYDNKPAVSMFGVPYKEDQHKDLIHYTSIRLIETNEDNTDFATWDDGRIIHLKPEGE